LRILFINRMASMERGGGETFDLEIARNLALLGHDVTFLTGIPIFGKAKLPIEAGKAKIKNIQLRSPYFGWFPWDKVKGGWRIRVTDFTIFEWLAARWAFNHRDQFDIIQICELPNVVVFFKSKIGNRISKIPRLVVRLTAPNYHDPRGGIPRADAIIASGTSLAKLRARGLSRAENIPNAVDTECFKPGVRGQKSETGSRASDLRPQTADFRRKHGIPESDLLILYVARFQEFKNHAMLIRAFAELVKQKPNTRMLLAGSGPLRSGVEKQIKEAGIDKHVVLLGEVAFDELPAVYAAADIKVVSSNYESFCFAAIEGMAAGVPVVTADNGWVPGLIGDTIPPIEKEWVDGETDPSSGRFEAEQNGKRFRVVPGGLVTGRNDHLSFAAALNRLAENPGERLAMGRWNREKAVREHGWLSSAKKLQDLYQRIVSTHE
jgi:glycosyltransferase involved in cell wall biosynthesis